MQISTNKVVAIDYTLTDDSGTVLDSSADGEPLAYLHGVGAIIPGLENALEGKVAGDQVQVHVAPGDGYGDRDENLRQAVPRTHFEGVDDLEVGMQFRVQGDSGPIVITVVEIGEEEVTVDGNHQLAGVPLNFDVTVREVRDATEEELSHGHAHGPGGHHH